MEVRGTWKLTRSIKSLRYLLAKNNFQQGVGEVPIANQCIKVRDALRELGKAMLCAALEVKMHFLCCNLIPAVCKITYVRVKIASCQSRFSKSSNESGLSLGT